MPRKPPAKHIEDQEQWEITEDLIFALAKQPFTMAPHRSTSIDAIITKCRDYVNNKVVPTSGMPTNRVGNPGTHRGTYSVSQKGSK